MPARIKNGALPRYDMTSKTHRILLYMRGFDAAPKKDATYPTTTVDKVPAIVR